jgi:hypothetical protein
LVESRQHTLPVSESVWLPQLESSADYPLGRWELVILVMERWRREEGLVSEWEMSLGVWSLSMSQWAEAEVCKKS